MLVLPTNLNSGYLANPFLGSASLNNLIHVGKQVKQHIDLHRFVQTKYVLHTRAQTILHTRVQAIYIVFV